MDQQQKQHCRQHRKKNAQKFRLQSAGHSSLKPIPPKEYDGAADAHAYHQFIKESEAYL